MHARALLVVISHRTLECHCLRFMPPCKGPSIQLCLPCWGTVGGSHATADSLFPCGIIYSHIHSPKAACADAPAQGVALPEVFSEPATRGHVSQPRQLVNALLLPRIRAPWCTLCTCNTMQDCAIAMKGMQFPPSSPKGFEL